MNLDDGVVVLDFETTGVDVEVDRIVTVFIGLLDRWGRLVAGRDFMVRPDGYVIPEGATEVHGVTTEVALAQGLDAGFVVEQVAEFIIEWCKGHGLPLVGHNLSYDLTILDREIGRYHPSRSGGKLLRGVKVLDTLVLDKHFDKYRKGKRTLMVTADVYGVELSEAEAHGARADAIASGRILLRMMGLFPGLADGSADEIMAGQVLWKAEQAQGLQDYFRTKADPLQPDAIVNGEWPYQRKVGYEVSV